MANDVQRKDLYDKQLGNIKKRENWLKACKTLGLRICRGSKHPETIRRPDMPEDRGRASLITVIPYNIHKGINQKIFKHLLAKSGKNEDEIWRALELL